MARAKSVLLTEQQEAFVNAKMEGKSDRQAAKEANYNSGAITKLSHNEKVRERLAEARAELQDVTTIRRVDIIDGILGAIERAKLQAEPATEIRGWVEISKIVGLDKPETARRALSSDAATLQNQLLNMTTAELLELAAGNAYIDGEATRVDH